jgi:hypothetical protein
VNQIEFTPQGSAKEDRRVGIISSPKPYDELKARFPAALERVWVASATGDRPGLHPENVFDTFDGYRVIISHEVEVETGEHVFHVSGSYWRRDKSPKGPKDVRIVKMAPVILWAFKRIAGFERQGTGVAHLFMTNSEGFDVLHFIYPMDPQLVLAAESILRR